MRISAVAALLALLLSACGEAEETAAREPVEAAWVRLPAVEGRPAAGYFVLNGGEADDVLLAVESPRAGTIELHETRMEGGAMRMRPIMSVPVPAGETVAFEPGGRHAMLFGLDPEITPGTPLRLTLRFESGSDVEIEAATVAAGDEAPFSEDGAMEHADH